LPYFAIPVWVGQKKLGQPCHTLTYFAVNQHVTKITKPFYVQNKSRTFAAKLLI
jgi:hypothetical protein